jgi:SAM-dependent methyltransferase
MLLSLFHLRVVRIQTGDYINAAETVKAAQAKGMSIRDYVEDMWGIQGSTQRIFDEMNSAGCFTNCQSVCEIGPGTGRYLELIQKRCPGVRYTIYETDKGWEKWLVQTYGVHAPPVDGVSLRPQPDQSADLINAHGVFVYLKPHHSFAYFKEMLRVIKPGGFLVFDILDIARLSKWIDTDHTYPVFLDPSQVTTFFTNANAHLVKTFTAPYGVDESVYHVYRVS